MEQNKLLLEIYKFGWENFQNIENMEELMKRAFISGGLDFWAGDDVSSIDLKSEEEILKQIYGINKTNRD